MNEWKKYRLGEILKIKYGKNHKHIDNGIIPIYGSGGIMRYGNQAITQGPSILIPRKGSLHNILFSSTPFWTVDTMFWTIIDTTIANPLFLYYAIHKKDFASLNVGSAVPSLTVPIIENIEVLLPSLPIQNKIANVLKSLDDKTNINRRINDNLEQQAQTLFDEWLSKASTYKGSFSDVIDTTLAGDWGQEKLQGNYTHEVFCIRGADIPMLCNGDKGKMPIRYILEKNYIAKQLSANDLVVEISGGSPTQSTGRICMITQSLLDRLGKDLVCTNFCRAITPKSGFAIFIFLYWKMLYNKNTMFSYENGTTGIKNLNIADFITKEKIDIPTIKDVNNLNDLLQPIYDQIYATGLQNERLSSLRDTLLPKLMSGEISVEDVSID